MMTKTNDIDALLAEVDGVTHPRYQELLDALSNQAADRTDELMTETMEAEHYRRTGSYVGWEYLTEEQQDELLVWLRAEGDDD